MKTFWIIGEICQPTLVHIVKLMSGDGVDSLRVLVHSGGGDLSVSSALIDILRPLREAGSLETLGLGEAYSAAPLILAAGSPGKRMAYRNCVLGLHEPYLEGEVVTAEQVRMYNSATDRFFNLLSELTGRRVSFWRRRLAGGAMQFYGTREAVRLGLIDLVV